MLTRLSLLILCLSAAYVSCTTNEHRQLDSGAGIVHDTSSASPLKPIFGYRFVIKGDFNGDGKKETLTELFYSGTEGKETNKFYENIPYDSLVALTVSKMPASFAVSSDPSIDTLNVAAEAQLLGIAFMKNEGDLDGDGGDEVSYVVNWADWSNLNSCKLVSYKKNKWVQLFEFDIWDWQLPEIPATAREYSIAGLGELHVTGNDSILLQMEKDLASFEGFIKKLDENRIRVRYKNEEASEDTMIFDLGTLTGK
jgi:hypothetical protein